MRFRGSWKGRSDVGSCPCAPAHCVVIEHMARVAPLAVRPSVTDLAAKDTIGRWAILRTDGRVAFSFYFSFREECRPPLAGPIPIGVYADRHTCFGTAYRYLSPFPWSLSSCAFVLAALIIGSGVKILGSRHLLR